MLLGSLLYSGTAVVYYDDYCLGRKAWAVVTIKIYVQSSNFCVMSNYLIIWAGKLSITVLRHMDLGFKILTEVPAISKLFMPVTHMLLGIVWHIRTRYSTQHTGSTNPCHCK